MQISFPGSLQQQTHSRFHLGKRFGKKDSSSSCGSRTKNTADMVLPRVMVLAHVMVLAYVMVLARVMDLACVMVFTHFFKSPSKDLQQTCSKRGREGFP